MRPNRLRQIWAEGRPVINAWCNIPGAFLAEAMASQGWDAVTIDTQHGLIGYDDMVAMLQAMAAAPVTPLVRVSWNAPGEIMKALDAGAYGVICPMINNRAEAEAFVGACRYPPLGYRSFGPIRASMYAGPGYYPEANAELLTFAMVETADGLANVDEIVATPGLDGIYIGPSDLSLSHGGQPNQDSQEPSLLAAFDRILAACKAAGIRTGVHTTSVAYSQAMIARGFDLVTVGADMRYLMAGRGEAKQMRDHIEGKD
ncbi:aldolase/citrate lyase family protein [Phenylobacterium sp.]|uniref:HpcH/HpaI aldolase family protein n=1 Tax=Phenylobacterium sp. TaxID=1871053 RepID=UPI0025F3E8AA|nr:aldolase/citrate lyase family protein [Phenylobacterium sp.]